MSEPKPLHRLFGLSWMDFFEGSGITVETEIDLSTKQQFIDLVLIRTDDRPMPRPLPDGFEDLTSFNLVTFKSYQESLDSWALCELVGHYVNFRKQFSPSMQDLLPESSFRLFAVCARYPTNLLQNVRSTALSEGVFEIQELSLRIRLIVLRQLPQAEQNAMLHLFSAREELLKYGREHYRPHSQESSTLLYQLFRAYYEDKTMSEKLKEYVRQSIDELLNSLPAEERLKGLPAEERLKGLSVDEVIRGLPPDTLEALTQKLKRNDSPPKSE